MGVRSVPYKIFSTYNCMNVNSGYKGQTTGTYIILHPLQPVTDDMIKIERIIWVTFILTITLHINKAVHLQRMQTVVKFNSSGPVRHTLHDYWIFTEIGGI